MTHDEMVKSVERLNELQKRFYKLNRVCDKEEMKSIRGEWSIISLSLKMGGYSLRKKTIRNDLGFKVGVEWFAVLPTDELPKRTRNKHSEFFRYVNVRPQGVKTLKGDCTTRCITFCLGADYLSVLAEQRRNSEVLKKRFNDNDIWDKALKDRGWKRVYLARNMFRRDIARLTSTIPHPIATSSSGHVCPTFGGKVIDIWESQNAKVNYVLCRADDEQNVRRLLRVTI